jgi:signal transduction histidine kinase
MSREWRALGAAVALAAGGVVVVRVGFASYEQRQAWLAVLTMWVVGGSGLLAWLRAPSSRVGLILLAVALSWGGAALAVGAVPGTDPASRIIGMGYTGILAQAIVTFPSGRLSQRTALPVVAGYLACVIPSPAGPAVIATVAVAGIVLRATDGPSVRVSPPAVVAGAVFAIGVGMSGLWPSLAPTVIPDPRLSLEAAMIVVAVVLSQALVRRSDRQREIESLVLELGAGSGDILTRRLRAFAGDPTLQVAYSMPETGRFVDATGRALVPTTDGDRETTRIGAEGAPVGLLVHRRGGLAEAGVVQAIGRAAGLASTNARLQAEVVAQLAEVEASRLRLAEAADDERRILRRRIEEGLEPLLADLESAIADAERRADGGRSGAGPIAHVREVRREIAELASGLPPRALDRGLLPAISALAAGSPVPVTVEQLSAGPASGRAQAALFFVCSEALANAVKHAHAASVTVRLTSTGGWATVEVADDGVGGADPNLGTGLHGLRRRLEDLDGTLSVESPTGRGTVVRASVPE